MNIFKKVTTTVLVGALAISGITINNADRNVMAGFDWQNGAITAPMEGKLIGAGHNDIKWNATLEYAKSYEVYLDGKLQKTYQDTDAEIMSHDFYTTTVSEHTAYVIANLKDGSKIKTATRKFFVTKKGICVNDRDMGQAVNPADMNVGWYYNGGTKAFEDYPTPKFANFNGYEYVPMIWGESISTSRDEAFAFAKEHNYKYMLGYNEPDLSWESNIEPDLAVKRWSSFSNTSFLLGSPATSVFPVWSDWWPNFWSQVTAKNYRIDFIAIHNYRDGYKDKNSALEYLQAIDETYSIYKKPIWITEFAVAGNVHYSYGKKEDVAKAQEFMKIVLKGLEERSYVERYAWFSFSPVDQKEYAKGNKNAPNTVNGASAIFNYYTGELTELGKIYAQLGNPKGYNAKTYGVDSSSSVNTSPEAAAAVVKTSLYTADGKKKAFEYTLKENKNVSGYQLQYATKANMSDAQYVDVSSHVGKVGIKVSSAVKKAIDKKNKKIKKYNKKVKKQNKKIKKYNKTHKKKKKLKKTKKLVKKQKYYVRARAKKSLNGKTLYCAWSQAVSTNITVK